MITGLFMDRGLGSLFGGVTPELLRDADALEEIRRRARPVHRRFNLCVAPLMLLAIGALTVGAAALRAWLDGPASSPIIDDTRWVSTIGFILASMLLVICAAAVVEHRVLPRMLGLEPSMWIRYYAASTGWLPHRHAVTIAVLIVPLFAFTLMAGMVCGDRVDEQGIAFRNGFARARLAHNDVAAVEHYHGVGPPAGPLMRPNLVVRFASGEVWRYDPDGKEDVPTPRDVAEFIAARSGKTIVEGGARP